jgi:hypothetical protein
VAAMPSFGLKQKLGVAVLTAAMFALSAGAASAKEAWVWACHGPSGGAIGTAMVTGGTLDGDATANCAGDENAGATLRLNGANPAGRSSASLSIQLPPGVTASRVLITHAVHGSAAGARYTVALDGAGRLVDQPLDAPGATLPTDISKSGSGTLTFNLTCDQSAACGGPVSVDVVKVGVLVDDTRSPYGSVGRNNPVNSITELVASAIEEGVGFSRVVSTIASAPSDDATVRSATLPIGSCDELTPGDATIDLPLDTSRCQTGSGVAAFTAIKDKNGVVLNIDKAIDSSGLDAGTYYRRVVVYDAAGNSADLLKSGDSVWEAFEVWHPSLGSATQTLSIGSSSLPEPQPQPNVNANQNGKPGSTAAACRSPRLSVSLSQKPLRVSKSVAVLQYGKRYRFQGRLSCVVNGRRISAPKRTKVQLFNKVGKRTVTKKGPQIAAKGRFKISLKYPRGSRKLIFRFTNATGQRSQVSIKIKTEKKKKSAKR